MYPLGTGQLRDTYRTESVAQSINGRPRVNPNDNIVFDDCRPVDMQLLLRFRHTTIRGFYSPPEKTFFCWFPATSIVFVRASSRITLDDQQLGE